MSAAGCVAGESSGQGPEKVSEEKMKNGWEGLKEGGGLWEKREGLVGGGG